VNLVPEERIIVRGSGESEKALQGFVFLLFGFLRLSLIFFFNRDTETRTMGRVSGDSRLRNKPCTVLTLAKNGGKRSFFESVRCTGNQCIPYMGFKDMPYHRVHSVH